MPTYICHARRGALTEAERAALAQRFTATHARRTGAPPSFVQVVFLELGEGAHFIAGQPADPRAVHVQGHIRVSRPAEVTQALTLALRDDVVAVTGMAAELVWVYLCELSPERMVEFGQTLPPAGDEAAWREELPAELRERLTRLDAEARE